MNEELKILIIDDSMTNLEALRRALPPEGSGIPAQYAVIATVTGAEALERAASDKPDLIILDVTLPGMDGFEVLTQLKSDESTRLIPVIVTSGLYTEEDEEMGLLFGAVDYIRRPFNMSVALARINTHLKLIGQMRAIEQLSLMDSLTNIPNRRNFDNQMIREFKRAYREKTPLSMLMIDADYFKKYNDEHGHQKGDAVLRMIALTASSSLKRPADFLARWGGEEFAALLPNTPESGAALVAEQIRQSIELIGITVSIGVATAMPEGGLSIEELIRRADDALYAAKEAGRNRVHF